MPSALSHHKRQGFPPLILHFVSYPQWSGKGSSASLEPRVDCGPQEPLKSHSGYKPVQALALGRAWDWAQPCQVGDTLQNRKKNGIWAGAQVQIL